MKVCSILITCICLLTGKLAIGQPPLFITHGQIEFEYKVNLYSQMEGDNDEGWKEYVKKNLPQFKSTYFKLTFDQNKTLYEPGKENPDNNKLWMGEGVADENVVYSDLVLRQSVSQKKAFEKVFLVKDSIRNIQWKITGETRKIAGFECRRANAVIMDSIYVVAFYCDEITTPGGPESFSGLPGMILGVAMPHEHVTWFATKLSLQDVKPADLRQPSRGKPINNAALKENLKESLKDWGKYANKYVKQIML